MDVKLFNNPRHVSTTTVDTLQADMEVATVELAAALDKVGKALTAAVDQMISAMAMQGGPMPWSFSAPPNIDLSSTFRSDGTLSNVIAGLEIDVFDRFELALRIHIGISAVVSGVNISAWHWDTDRSSAPVFVLTVELEPGTVFGTRECYEQLRDALCAHVQAMCEADDDDDD